MSPSLLATMKIVALMISIDKVIHPAERSWFLALMNTFGATRTQRRILKGYLSGNHKDEIPSLIANISDNRDKSRLLNLLTVAIHTDKFVSISEKEFYQHIKHLLYTSLPEIRDLHLKLGQELQKRDRRVQLWKELGNLGNTLNTRRGMYYWYYPYDTFDVLLIMSWLGESLFSGKMKYVIYALLIALGLFVFST